MAQAAADPLMMPLPLALGLGLGRGSDNSVHKAMLTMMMQCTCFLLHDSVQASGKAAAGNFQNQIRFWQLMGHVDKPSTISEPECNDAHELPVLDKQFLKMLSQAVSYN